MTLPTKANSSKQLEVSAFNKKRLQEEWFKELDYLTNKAKQDKKQLNPS